MSASPAGAAAEVPALLEEYGALARTRLAHYLGSTSASADSAYLYELAAEYPRRGGRSLRPTLCMAAARAFGAPVEDALNSAVSLEILHNAFLVHDDIEDLSEERRGRPTLHALHGVPIAVNVGDAMAVFSLRPLIDNRRTLGSRLALRILEEAERMARETVEGQAIELAWRRRNALDLEEADYLGMILKKTCWYSTIFPLRAGAIIGTRDQLDGGRGAGSGRRLDALTRFGFFLGAAFQIEDDLLNLVGDHERYGKETNGDLWEGKRTLMLIRLLGLVTQAERDRLRTFLAQPRERKRASDVRWVRRLLDRHGCLEYARQAAHGLAGAALHEFSSAFADVPESRDKAFIRALASWVLSRS
jgi:geranylgeranyl diphosphate synthase, type II